MTWGMAAANIQRVILGALRAAVDAPLPAIARHMPLGTSGERADLAVWADEWIGFAVRAADDPIATLPATLRTYASYFDRVALVVDPSHLATLRSVDLYGAALWSVAGDSLAEHAAGAPNLVGMSALFDLLPAKDRRTLLRPLVPQGPAYDRDNPPITPAEVRAYVERVLVARYATAEMRAA